MKNDARLGGKKISVRPTLLISLMGIVPDTRLVPSSGFTKSADSIFLVGQTRTELSGSIIEHLLQAIPDSKVNHLGLAPTVDLPVARIQYERLARAIQHGLVRSVHDLSDGGLAVALAESAFHRRLGFRIDISQLTAEVSAQVGFSALPADSAGLLALFAETPSRLLVSVSREHEDRFLRLMDGSTVHRLGEVRNENVASITWSHSGSQFVALSIDEALAAWKLRWND